MNRTFRGNDDWGRRAQRLEGSADYGQEGRYPEPRGYGFIGDRDREGPENAVGIDPGHREVARERSQEIWRGRNEEHDFWGFERRPPSSLWARVRGAFTGRGPKNYVRSDERIREDVCEHLSYHPYIDATDIDVIVRDGEVTLSGTVDGRMVKRAAEECCEDVRGVRDVHNHLRVKRPDLPMP